MPREIQMALDDEAANEEGRRWVYEAAELARMEGLLVHEIEDYDWGTLARFTLPENPAKEADVFISYKRVHWLGETDFCSSIRVMFTTDELARQIQAILEALAYRYELISGYEFDGHFGEFVKNVDTKGEAVAELKNIIPRVREVARKLDEIKRQTEDFVQALDKVM